MNRLYFSLLILFYASLCSAQELANIDSLLNRIQKGTSDSEKVLLMCNVASAYTFKEPHKAVQYAKDGIQLSEKIKFFKGKADCYHQLGYINYYQGDYKKSLENYLTSLRIFEKLLPKTSDKTDIKRGMGDNLHDMAKVYYRQGQHEKSLKTFNEALALFKELSYKQGIAGCYNNMAGVYDALKDFDKTLFYLQEFLKISEEMGSKIRIATGVNNIGLMYKLKGNYKEALSNLNKGLKIREEIKDIKGLAFSHTDIGNLYIEIKDYKKGLFHLHQGLKYAKIANAKERLKESYDALSNTYAKLNKYKEAYDYRMLLSSLKDSLLNEESIKQVTEMSTKYESDKKQHQIELLQKDKQLQLTQLAKSDAEAKKQQVQKFAFASGFGFVFILTLLTMRSYRQKKRDNLSLSLQKSIIEEKNKDILDSIKYAKRIQEAILPPAHLVKQLIPHSFILYKPKDIVSGDFYWLEKKEDKVLIAAVDCTGHGVPGALMSIVGHNGLTRAVNEHNITKPSEILDYLNKVVNETLRQTYEDSTVKDGMDIACCSIDLIDHKLEFAGANNPLILVRGKEIIEIKGDKKPVGSFIDEIQTSFTHYELEVKKGDNIYLFTDGFADQFGGEKGKKFKYTKIKELLLSVQTLPMTKQKEAINEAFEEWKGNLEQVDDVCLLGIQI